MDYPARIIQKISEYIAALVDSPQMIHSMLVHFPVVLSFVGVPLVFLALISKKYRNVYVGLSLGCYMLLIGFASASVKSGENAIAELPGSLAPEIWNEISRHESMAEKVWIFGVVTILFVGAALVQHIRERKGYRILQSVALCLSIITVGWVGLTASRGGGLLYRYGIGSPPIVVVTHRAELASQDIFKGSDGEMIVHEQLKSESHFARAMNTEEAPEYTTVSYKDDVLPILLDTCIGCHGDTDPESDFNLSTFDDFIAGGKKFGSPILTDNPANSPLIRYVTGELDPQMPKGEPALSTSQIAILTSWISDGAKPPEGYVKSAKAKKPQRKRTTSDDRLEFRYQHLSKASLEARDRIDPDAIGEEIFLDRKVGIHGIRRALRRAYIPTDEFSALIPESKNAIDWFIEREWKDKGVVDTANPCTDTDFVRRVYLDIIGVLPDADEARAFFDDPAPDKRTALIDALLARSEEYADHWVPFWEDLLVSAPKQVDDERANNFDWHGYYRDWLYESFKKNKPLDQLVLELFDESLEDYQPRYMLTDSPDAVLQNVSAMSKVFMGISLRCTQCHNHFQNKQWTQSTIHGLGSFFTQDDLEIVRCLKPTGVKVAPKFIFPLPGEETVSNQSRRLDQVDFASHLVDPTHPLFSRTMVNRIWNRYLGRGISEPIDDFRFDILPNHMELWTWLSNDLARNEFDIKRLVRMILASDTYQRGYDGNLEDKPTRTNNTERHYLSPKLRRMSAEQFVDSARKILDLPYEGNDRSYRAMLVSPLEQSLGRQARSQVITKRSEEPSVVQALEFINGASLNELVYESPFVQKESKRLLDPDKAAEVIEALYWGCHSRQPSTEEVAATLDYVQRLDAENLVDDRQILGDLYWAHLMSSDFLFIQ